MKPHSICATNSLLFWKLWWNWRTAWMNWLRQMKPMWLNRKRDQMRGQKARKTRCGCNKTRLITWAILRLRSNWQGLSCLCGMRQQRRSVWWWYHPRAVCSHSTSIRTALWWKYCLQQTGRTVTVQKGWTDRPRQLWSGTPFKHSEQSTQPNQRNA